MVYLGLTYLGVTTSRFFDLSVPRTFLVVAIVRNLLGQPGTVLFAVIVALAIGLPNLRSARKGGVKKC